MGPKTNQLEVGLLVLHLFQGEITPVKQNLFSAVYRFILTLHLWLLKGPILQLLKKEISSQPSCRLQKKIPRHGSSNIAGF